VDNGMAELIGNNQVDPSGYIKSPFPVLRTSRLVLRELGREDTPSLHAIWSDPVVLEFLVLEPFEDEGRTTGMIDLLKGLPAATEGIRWAVTLAGNGSVIGTCGFHNWKREHGRAEMGYELGKEFWRQGYMTEALSAILKFGFGTMRLNRIEAFVTDGNERSLGLLRKLGFTAEGCLREYEWARGKYQDQWICSLLKTEWVSPHR
jgi:ribosomal-protein-alanine N-acetyltransferase